MFIKNVFYFKYESTKVIKKKVRKLEKKVVHFLKKY